MAVRLGGCVLLPGMNGMSVPGVCSPYQRSGNQDTGLHCVLEGLGVCVCVCLQHLKT